MIALQSSFIITSAYPRKHVRKLFEVILELEEATAEHFILELEQMANENSGTDVSDRTLQIYDALYSIAVDEETKQTIR